VRSTCARLRIWDRRTAARPTAILANSAFVAARIRRYWNRDAVVVYPPVEVERFRPSQGDRTYYLLAGAFAPYKRAELAIAACRALDRPLVVAGTGQDERRLRGMAGGNIEFRGWVEGPELAALYAGARALLFPGEEDFGITPVEAMASGCPVIAFGSGGVLETVGRDVGAEARARIAAGEAVVGSGGVLFGRQTVEGLSEAIRLFESHRFDSERVHSLAEPFDAAAFDRAYTTAFEDAYRAWRGRD
jgi:glycosyltransferase involved in cell wall biosynthesis